MDYPIAFTQTVLRNNLTIKDQYKEFLPEVESALRLIGDYIIYPELTLENTIHFHGKIKVNDRYQYHKQLQRLRKRLGFNKCKLIDNTQKWDEYIQKDKPLMEKLLNVTLPIQNVVKLPDKVLEGTEATSQGGDKKLRRKLSP